MGSRAFWAVVFGFLSGVFLRSFLLIGWSAVILSALLGISMLGLLLLDRDKTNTYVLLAVTLFSGAVGIARMQLAVVTGDPGLTSRIGKSVMIEGTVSQEPDARDTATLVQIDASGIVIGTSDVPVHAGVLAQLPAHARVSYGDQVQISGALGLPQAFDTDTGREFDYPEYLAAQGIEYQLRYAQVDSIFGNSGNPLKAFAIGTKEDFLRGLGLVMPDPEAALAGGITVGDKRSVGPDLANDFQRDSLVHMLVLSGYNITVVLNAVARTLAWTPRYLQFGASSFVVVFFMFMAGGASSAVRAGLMALIAVVARATHRVYLGERVIAFVSLVMVAWNPWTLCFDPSFQLSTLATLGLIMFTPAFAAWLEWMPEKFAAREIVSSTCATQLMVLPFLLYQSGTLSIVALPANLLALLPVPWAMLLALIAGVGGMIAGPVATVLSFPAYALLWYIVSIAHVFSELPFASTPVPAFSAGWMFAAYGALFVVWKFFTKKSRPVPEGPAAS